MAYVKTVRKGPGKRKLPDFWSLYFRILARMGFWALLAGFILSIGTIAFDQPSALTRKIDLDFDLFGPNETDKTLARRDRAWSEVERRKNTSDYQKHFKYGECLYGPECWHRRECKGTPGITAEQRAAWKCGPEFQKWPWVDTKKK